MICAIDTDIWNALTFGCLGLHFDMEILIIYRLIEILANVGNDGLER